MATVEESVQVGASLAEAWESYFQPDAWPEWVDGFQSVVDSDGYPAVGGTLRWRSTPAGRGEVTERVLEHSERRAHRVEFADPAMTGQMETRFAIAGDGTTVTQRVEYRLLQRGPIALLAGALFVSSQVRRSMRRTLLDFAEHAEHVPR